MEPDNTYIQGALKRFNQLTPDEVDSLMSLYGTPELITISKVLGPEVSKVLGVAMNNLAEPKPAEKPKKGLGARRPKK